jgi:hypothetical protein
MIPFSLIVVALVRHVQLISSVYDRYRGCGRSQRNEKLKLSVRMDTDKDSGLPFSYEGKAQEIVALGKLDEANPFSVFFSSFYWNSTF